MKQDESRVLLIASYKKNKIKVYKIYALLNSVNDRSKMYHLFSVVKILWLKKKMSTHSMTSVMLFQQSYSSEM